MRTTPIVGKKLWFGPRAWLGWGWTPVSWEGWTLLIATVGSTLGVVAFFPDNRLVGPMVLLTVAVLVAACILKGSSPGGPGPGARREFLEKREQQAARRRPA